MIVIAIALIAFAFIGNPMTMISTDRSVDLPAGEVVDVPFKYKYDDAWEPYIPASTQGRIKIDYDGSQGSRDDVYLSPWSISSGQTVDSSFPLQVYGDLGEEYTVQISVEIKQTDGSWDDLASKNKFDLCVTVAEPDSVTDEDISEDIGELDFDATLVAVSLVSASILALIVGMLFVRRKGQ